jgi:23S rRNA pseudouridine1911/1915/1917 synthase
MICLSWLNAKVLLILCILSIFRYLQAYRLLSHRSCCRLWNNLPRDGLVESIQPSVMDGSPSGVSSLIVYEDDHLVVVNKPSGYLSQTASNMEDDSVNMLSLLNNHYQRNLSVIHRLDRPCSGLLVYGMSSLATSGLNALMKNRLVKKKYLAVVNGRFQTNGWMTLSHKIEKTSDDKVMIISQPAYDKLDHRQQIKYVDAELSCRAIKSVVPQLQQNAGRKVSSSRDEDYQTVIDIDLETGRKHQIRAQLAASGHAICGDKKYGAKQSFRARDIALHAYCLDFRHPVTKREMRFRQQPPPVWQRRFGEEMCASINELLSSPDS